MRTMQAAVLTGPGQVGLEVVAIPEPGPRQVRIRLEGCGVCASNLTPWAGPEWMRFPTEPGALGHEGWGVVDAVGDHVVELSPGDRVAALSQHAYAEYDLADAEAVVPLPPSRGSQPFPGEPLGCAMNIFRRSGIEPGQKHYYRVQGPSFLIEYDNTQGNGNHIHSVWRDLTNDFGDDLLKKHYEENHQN